MQQRGVEADCYSSLQVSQYMGEKNSKVLKSLALNCLLWVGEKNYMVMQKFYLISENLLGLESV